MVWKKPVWLLSGLLSLLLSGFTAETVETYVKKYGEPGAQDVGESPMLTWQDGWVRRWLKIGPTGEVLKEGAIYAKNGHLPLDLYPQTAWLKTAQPYRVEGVHSATGFIEGRWYRNGVYVKREWLGAWLRMVSVTYPAGRVALPPAPTATPGPAPALPAADGG